MTNLHIFSLFVNKWILYGKDNNNKYNHVRHKLTTN